MSSILFKIVTVKKSMSIDVRFAGKGGSVVSAGKRMLINCPLILLSDVIFCSAITSFGLLSDVIFSFAITSFGLLSDEGSAKF